MLQDRTIAWGLFAVFVLVGIGMLFARVDERQLELLARWSPVAGLYRLPGFRYGVAVVFFVLASVVYIEALS